jgi:ribosomal protein L37AE/L43A
MKETRKQKIARQQGAAADRMMAPIHAAMDRGELVITPLSGREYCPQCGSGPRQREDVEECPDCGRKWAGPRLLP